MKHTHLLLSLLFLFALCSTARATDYERNETTHYFDYIGTPLETDLEVDFSELTSDMVEYASSTIHSETLLEFQGLGLYKYCYDVSPRPVDSVTYTLPRAWNSCSSQVNGVTKRNDTIAKYYPNYDRCAIYFPEMKYGIRYIVVEGWSYQSASNILFKKQNTDGTWSDIASSSQLLQADSYTSDTLFLNSRNIKRVMFYRGNTQHQKWQFITKIKVVQMPHISIYEDADNSAVLSEYNGETVSLEIHRTIKGGMYNTICLPCTVSVSNLKAALAVGQLDAIWFNAATMEDGVLDMQFTTASTLQAGAPYLIKTDVDVTEPFMLEGVEIKNTPRHISKPDEASALVKFYGFFNPTAMTASPNKLVLGADDTLYYIDHNLTIQGLRGYFQLAGSAAASAPPVRIRYSENTTTDLPDVQSDEVQCTKMLRDGQVVILREGVMYNSLGQIVK